jgi:hypothetical protein
MSQHALDLYDLVPIATNRHGWTFVVGRLGDRWLGGALGKGTKGQPNFLNVFHQVAEGHYMGVTDRALAVRITCAVALSPEESFGGVDRWLIPKAERGTLADLPPEETDDYGDFEEGP